MWSSTDFPPLAPPTPSDRIFSQVMSPIAPAQPVGATAWVAASPGGKGASRAGAPPQVAGEHAAPQRIAADAPTYETKERLVFKLPAGCVALYSLWAVALPRAG